MKRHPTLIPLSHEHRRILFFCQMIKRAPTSFKDAPVTTPDKLLYARGFVPDLYTHFDMEERVLAPTVRGIDAELDQLLDEVLAEHAMIRERIDDLHTLAQETQQAAALDHLGHMIEAHVRKEERALFQQLQAVVREEVLADLQMRLQ